MNMLLAENSFIYKGFTALIEKSGEFFKLWDKKFPLRLLWPRDYLEACCFNSRFWYFSIILRRVPGPYDTGYQVIRSEFPKCICYIPKVGFLTSYVEERVKYVWEILSSVQFNCLVVSDSLWPHEPQHARPPCPSPTLKVYPNSCPLSWWCHPTTSSSVVPFSSCLPSICPSIRVFSNESVLHIRWPYYWSFSFSISPSNE